MNSNSRAENDPRFESKKSAFLAPHMLKKTVSQAERLVPESVVVYERGVMNALPLFAAISSHHTVSEISTCARCNSASRVCANNPVTNTPVSTFGNRRIERV